jgi:hypothetical protein
VLGRAQQIALLLLIERARRGLRDALTVTTAGPRPRKRLK